MRWVQVCGSLSILWHCLFLGLEWKLTISRRGHCWVFQICWHIEWSIFTASSFRIWNSSTRIPSPPLALFVVMLSKAHLTSHSRMALGEWSHHRGYLGHEDLFNIVLLYILPSSLPPYLLLFLSPFFYHFGIFQNIPDI